MKISNTKLEKPIFYDFLSKETKRSAAADLNLPAPCSSSSGSSAVTDEDHHHHHKHHESSYETDESSSSSCDSIAFLRREL